MWQLAIQGETQGIWFWAALYILIVCVYSLIFQIRTRYWHSTQGELVEFELEKFGGIDRATSDQDYVSKSLYKYTVSDVAYDGFRISPWLFIVSHNTKFILVKQMSSIQRLPNGKIKIFCNPNNPKKSFLIVAGKIGISITLALCVLPLILFYFKYYV
jgi:hypothetical protein